MWHIGSSWFRNNGRRKMNTVGADAKDTCVGAHLTNAWSFCDTNVVVCAGGIHGPTTYGTIEVRYIQNKVKVSLFDFIDVRGCSSFCIRMYLKTSMLYLRRHFFHNSNSSLM